MPPSGQGRVFWPSRVAVYVQRAFSERSEGIGSPTAAERQAL